jgi:hypothetical protein
MSGAFSPPLDQPVHAASVTGAYRSEGGLLCEAIRDMDEAYRVVLNSPLRHRRLIGGDAQHDPSFRQSAEDTVFEFLAIVRHERFDLGD